MVANRLRAWRQRLGLTQQELTEIAGVSIATLVLIERYGHLPGEKVRNRLCSALGVDVAAIWPVEVNDDRG